MSSGASGSHTRSRSLDEVADLLDDISPPNTVPPRGSSPKGSPRNKKTVQSHAPAIDQTDSRSKETDLPDLSSNANGQQKQQEKEHHDPEDDEEFRVAKQMALAFQQNPGMSPEQVRAMVLKDSSSSMQMRASAGSGTFSKNSNMGKVMNFVTGTDDLSESSSIGDPTAPNPPVRTLSAPPATLTGGHKNPSLKKALKSGVKSAVSPLSSAAKQTGKTMSKATNKATGAVSKATNKVSKATNKVTKATAKAIGVSSSSKNKEKHGEIGPMTERASILEDSTQIRARSSSHGNSMDNTAQPRLSTQAYNPMSLVGEPPIRLTGIVWKRRSGFGKFSAHTAWERRRIVLRGTKIYYFRTLVDSADDEEERQLQQNYNGPIPEEGPDDGGDGSPLHAKKATSWLQQATANVTNLAATVNITSGDLPSSSDDDAARGCLDLVKESVSVGASYGHTGAPTPFAMSVKVLAQTKWKFCFDTQAELMQWLAAMTDVVVQGSVDAYNNQIVKNAAIDPTLSTMGQLSEPPMTAAGKNKSRSSTSTGSGPVAAAGHRLWMTGPYTIKTHDSLQELEEEMKEVLVDSDFEGDADSLTPGLPPDIAAGESSLEEMAEEILTDNWWNIPEKHIFYAGVIVNTAMFLARASSTSTSTFWMILTFANFGLFSLLSEDMSKEITVVASSDSKSQVMVRRTTMLMRSTSSLGLPGVKLGSSRHNPAKSNLRQKEKLSRRKSSIGASKTIQDTAEDDGVYHPVAGTTSMKIKNPTDLPVNKNGAVFAGWREAPSDSIAVRSHGYMTSKKKLPAPGALYKCSQVDIFESDNRYPDMAGRVILPKVDFEDDGLPKTWNAPDVFVVSIAIPTSPPKLRGGSEDGGGYTVTAYFTMHQETRDILRRVTADGYNPANEQIDQKSKVNAVRLLDEWCRRAPTDDSYMARFKVVPNALNLKEIGMPSWISKYNAKPFLIKRPGQTGFLFRHPHKSCMEFDISLHPFPYLAKQGICFMKETYFKKVLVTFGFLIEGRTDDELPECFIGLMQLCYPDPVHAIQAPDFFTGRSPKSFEPS